jgi:hypothetical protein
MLKSKIEKTVKTRVTVERLCCTTIEVEVEVNLWPTVSRPVYPRVRRPSMTRDQFFFLLEISFRQLRLCYFVAPSLTRGQVCNLLVQLQLPQLLEQSLLGRRPAELTAIFYCLSWDSPNLEGQVPVFISPRPRWPSYTPGHWVALPLLASGTINSDAPVEHPTSPRFSMRHALAATRAMIDEVLEKVFSVRSVRRLRNMD